MDTVDRVALADQHVYVWAARQIVFIGENGPPNDIERANQRRHIKRAVKRRLGDRYNLFVLDALVVLMRSGWQFTEG